MTPPLPTKVKAILQVVPALYDRIGATYRRFRRPDPRIAALIMHAVGDAEKIVNVGAGAGSYEPDQRDVVAVEPSQTMIDQRPKNAAPVVPAVAERLPFRDGQFDAALALLTMHHWSDPTAGLLELSRVAPRQVVLTWDPRVWAQYWFIAEYLPEMMEIERDAATLSTATAALNVRCIEVVPVPWDCTDGFFGAYWRRPHMYLDEGARSAISGFARCDDDVARRALARLERDLHDGSWERRHRDLLDLASIDLGYRLVVAGWENARP